MMVHTFLTKFDAIFSLNQDLLLERHYLNDNVMLADKRRWDGWQIPGMSLQVDSVQPLQPRATGIWVPSGSIARSARHQPLYKLHGSSNWRDRESSSLLIIGGEKAHAIRAHDILSRYASEFQSRLSRPDTRLMIIGYGFRDQHINEVISSAVTRGLKFYLIDPAGSGLARSLNPTRHPGMIQQSSLLEETFETGLIGASRRRLADIFGNDDVEHSKVMQFFDS
jgi:hypothetical protein